MNEKRISAQRSKERRNSGEMRMIIEWVLPPNKVKAVLMAFQSATCEDDKSVTEKHHSLKDNN